MRPQPDVPARHRGGTSRHLAQRRRSPGHPTGTAGDRRRVLRKDRFLLPRRCRYPIVVFWKSTVLTFVFFQVLSLKLGRSLTTVRLDVSNVGHRERMCVNTVRNHTRPNVRNPFVVPDFVDSYVVRDVSQLPIGCLRPLFTEWHANPLFPEDYKGFPHAYPFFDHVMNTRYGSTNQSGFDRFWYRGIVECRVQKSIPT